MDLNTLTLKELKKLRKDVDKTIACLTSAPAGQI